MNKHFSIVPELEFTSIPIKGKKRKLKAVWNTSNPTFIVFYPNGSEVKYWL